MNRSHSMTLPQRVIVDQLKADGFTVIREGASIRMKRGNDVRVVCMNGTQKRGGARG